MCNAERKSMDWDLRVGIPSDDNVPDNHNVFLLHILPVLYSLPLLH